LFTIKPSFVFRIHPDATKKIGVIIIHPTSTGPYVVKKHLRRSHGRRLLEKNDYLMRYGSETKKLNFVEVMELSASIATSQFQAREA
jgi:predicted HTH transcriptional regulator